MFKVHYFSAYGSAESLRLLLAHARQPFENVDYTQESLAEAKKTDLLEFKQLPLLEFEGKRFVQSHAILRLLGRKFGYYPTEDAYEAYLVDSMLESFKDTGAAFSKAAFNPDEEEKKRLFAELFETTLPKWFAILEKRLVSNSSQKHMVGDKQTIIDFMMSSFAFSMIYNDANPGAGVLVAIVSKFPALQAYFEAQREENKEYLATRRVSPW
ncbi:hypothetical protein FGO68_gene13056 [Halteria grandinella]|uniref:Glutathione S-transferase n=1 Tax=Halteria grandinella TaxID=5974 RepID=A0A8J8NJZ3_HALGN|nr:hypothetical protein FGO68_gene13056 [Halteria grandinella]